MSSLTDYAEDALLNHVFRNTAYTPVATVYVALFTVAPTDAGGGTEVSGAGYARQAVTFGAPSANNIENSGQVAFSPSGGNYGTVVAMAIMDAVSAGNMLAWDAVTNEAVNDGDNYNFEIGDIDITIGTPFSDYLKDNLLNLMFRNQAYSSPTTVYTGLYTVAPTDAGGGTEVAGNGYARQATAFGAPSGGVVSNTAAELFTASGGNWGNIIHAGIFDAVSAGNLLFHDAITSATINDGNSLNFPIGDIDVGLS